MLLFYVKRILMLIPTIIGITIISFGLIRLVPGDPIMLMLGERGSDPAAVDAMKAQLGLDKPLLVQYGSFVGRALKGDLGTSVISKRPVLDEFMTRFPATLELSLVALMWAILIGVPLGIIAAVKRNSVFDYSLMGASLVGYSMPIFWWGLILILFFSVKLGITPVSGRMSSEYDIAGGTGFMLIDTLRSTDGGPQAFKDAVLHLILPSIALGTIPLAVIARMTRSSLLEVISEDYIRTAKAKGLSAFKVIGVHAMRNALIPIVTVIGLLFGTLITGAILTESIFSWPGLGKWLVSSVTSRDYPVVQSGILIISLMVIAVNTFVDMTYAAINPRMRG